MSLQVTQVRETATFKKMENWSAMMVWADFSPLFLPINNNNNSKNSLPWSSGLSVVCLLLPFESKSAKNYNVFFFFPSVSGLIVKSPVWVSGHKWEVNIQASPYRKVIYITPYVAGLQLWICHSLSQAALHCFTVHSNLTNGLQFLL